MSFESERSAIEQRFATQWDEDEPVKYDNIDFTPPIDGSYAALEIHSNPGICISTSGSHLLERTTGLIVVTIYTPLGVGTRPGRLLADTAADIFRFAQFGGIQCRGAEIKRIGEHEGKFIYVVRVPYWRDEAVAV